MPTTNEASAITEGMMPLVYTLQLRSPERMVSFPRVAHLTVQSKDAVPINDRMLGFAEPGPVGLHLRV
jgi:hypothetical protein